MNKKLLLLPALAVLFIVLITLVSGVSIRVNNLTAFEITRIKIEYSQGEVIFLNIPPGQATSKWLGKIGEGTQLNIIATLSNGHNINSDASVYFYSHSPFEKINIDVHPEGKIVFIENDKVIF